MPRRIDLARETLVDPPEPWELPADESDLRTYASLRRAAYAFIPHSFDSPELPPGAVAELERSVGGLVPGRVILLPRTPRAVGAQAWVVTPACVMGVGDEAVALWADRGQDRIVARIPYAEVAAVVDLTVLLFGRMEIAGPDTSIILRYNTVGRPEIRAALEVVRGAFDPLPALPGAPAGPRPDELPHKWMALVRSGDLRPADDAPRIVATGTLTSRKSLRRPGVAVASAREVVTAVEPDLAGGVGVYGVDLVALPAARVRRLTAAKDCLETTVTAGVGEVALRIPAHQSLADAVAREIAPSLLG